MSENICGMENIKNSNVLIIQNTILHYRIPIWNELAKYCNLTVAYSLGEKPSAECVFKIIHLPVKKIPGGLYYHTSSIKKLSTQYDVIITMSDLHWPKLALLPLYSKARVVDFGIGVSTSKGFDVDRSKDWLRVKMMKYADALLYYSSYPIEKYYKLGIQRDKQFVAPNTVKVHPCDQNNNRDTILFMGTLRPRKGLDKLLDAYYLLKDLKGLPPLVIVGKGPEQQNIERWMRDNEMESLVKMAGPVYDIDEKAKYFSRAIACISPSQAGLTVLESMGNGVPFVTTKNAITGGELFNIEDGVTGIVMDDINELVNVIKNIVEDPDKYRQMGISAMSYYNQYRKPEDMVRGFVEAIKYVTNIGKRPKLLQINSSCNSGSTGRIAEQIGEIVHANGWESFIAFGREYNRTASHPIKIGGKVNLFLHGIESLLFDRHGLGSRFSTWLLVKKIKKISPDIIHLHNIHGYYLNYRILFKYLSKANIPVLWTLHSCWMMTGHCTYFESVKCQKWKTQCKECPLLNAYPKSLLFDRSRKNYSLKKKSFTSVEKLTLVPVSKWLGDLAKESFLGVYPVHVIYNGVDTSLFSSKEQNSFREKNNLEEKIILLGVAAIWETRKGLKDYLELSKILDDRFVIVLVGINNDQAKKLPHNIIPIKRTESVSELSDIYRSADILLSLSYAETFGMTPVEAMACGTPAIVYDNTGQKELVNEDTGAVVKTGDIEAVYKSIEDIMQKGKSYYSDNCKMRVKQYYSKAKSFETYYMLYKEILAQNSQHTDKQVVIGGGVCN